jgi:very-short-patch-repair endonuclease
VSAVSASHKFPSFGGVAEGRGGLPSSREMPGEARRGALLVAEGRGGFMRNTTNYMSLPYNPALKGRARELRRAGNLAEVLFWQQVKNKQFLGLDFDRQKIIGNYIVDFYCAEKQVVIEIDGSSHDQKADYDAIRDAFLTGLGLTVIHVRAEDVKSDLTNVIGKLKEHPACTESTTSPPKEGWPKARVVSISEDDFAFTSKKDTMSA